MHLDSITYADIEPIGKLQPDGWTDIREAFNFYINSDFCYPVKFSIDDKIVGTGSSKIFNTTAWIAHIIVDKEYRNRGIGTAIVDHLLKDIKNRSIETVLLIATEIGEPVYKKAGFRTVSDYIFHKRESPWKEKTISDKIKPYKNEYYNEILRLDREISGECREPLISGYLDNSYVYIEDKMINGFYLPALGDGPIFAGTTDAGLELMKLKYSKVDKAVLPGENQAGIEFLRKHGFIITETKGKRMILGKEIAWKPGKLFSRTGGNFG
jgi:ribosomal protein S18 acetylase RimI-like enzyme